MLPNSPLRAAGVYVAALTLAAASAEAQAVGAASRKGQGPHVRVELI